MLHFHKSTSELGIRAPGGSLVTGLWKQIKHVTINRNSVLSELYVYPPNNVLRLSYFLWRLNELGETPATIILLNK